MFEKPIYLIIIGLSVSVSVGLYLADWAIKALEKKDKNESGDGGL